MAWRGRLGVLATVLALGALTLAASAQARTPSTFFGVVPQGPLTLQDYQRMGQAKVGLLRFELFWAGADPTPAPNDLDWSASDQVIRNAALAGVQTLPFIYSTPPWVAQGLDGYTCPDPECPPFAPRSQAARDAWAAFIAAAVRRYGPGGEFWQLNPGLPQFPVRAWQLWNEQNSPTFYKPKPKPKGFVKLMGAGSKAIKSVDPGADVVMGGMFGTPLGGRKPGVSAWDFLEKVYRVKGAKRTFDGIAPHPYAAKFKKKVLAQIALLRDEIKDARDKKVGMWITELGWASGGRPNPLNRGPRGQAARLKQAFKYFKRKRKRLNVKTVVWYSWRDNSATDVGLCEWCPDSGLLEENYVPKPSLGAFTRFTGGS